LMHGQEVAEVVPVQGSHYCTAGFRIRDLPRIAWSA
jgi:hypothetical protein